MIKWLRRVLYIMVIIIGFYSWHVIQKARADSALNQFKKDLFLSEVTPKEPPPFTLTDQHGKEVSLSDFKNKKLVIQPMDPACTDICPLVSEELIDADKQLGPLSQNVVYIGLNVNEDHNKVQDVKAFTVQHGLSKLKNWYFLTGSPEQLQKIWKAYGIAVVPNKNGDVMHTSALIFVDSKGKEVFSGTPQNDKTSVKEWADAISFILKQID